MNISEHRICWIPKFLSNNEKSSTYIIYLKYIKQNTDFETNEYFSSIWRNVFQELSKMPNFKPKKKY
jgi:thymidylate synthase ThyX